MATGRVRRALAALALAVFAPGAHAVEFGTLFNSPEERARLDRLRRGEPEIASGVPARSAVPAVTGYVRRSDGRNTVWIDGSPVVVTTPEAAAILDSKDPRGALKLPGGTFRVERKGTR